MSAQELDRATLLRLASLARIDVRDDELEPFVDAIDEVLGFVKGLALKNAVAGASAQPEGTRLREDTARAFTGRDAALANAPSLENQAFRVPKGFA
jgi:aspartyl-tRNA(Asn)/glutamyl-tRNA(Gln) amidotransferase subunit C